MSYSKKQILQALRNVKHPETAQDVVAMGMVDDIWIEGDQVGFTLSFKRANDPFINSMKKVCVQAIEKYFGAKLSAKGNVQVKTPEKKSAPQPSQNTALKGIKNIIAVASGVTDGIGYGDNTKAALITRGLAEIVKFGLYLNTNRETYNGLAGLGDLVVTCNSDHSRNRRFGIQIGKGKSFKEAETIVNQVVEGAKTAKAVYKFLEKNDDIEMPITEQVYKVLYENKDPHEALDDLMLREPRNEFYYLS